jgi:ferrous iron transport protein B
MADVKKILLIGNPNAGKTSVFNRLTGLQQKVGNFPGVTVERKQGTTTLSSGKTILVMDLPGAYSLHPTAEEEYIVLDYLLRPAVLGEMPTIFYIADITNLERQLLLLSQIICLGYPILLGITMSDVLKEEKNKADLNSLANQLNLPVFALNGRTGEGLTEVKDYLETAKGESNQPFLGSYTVVPQEVLSRIKAQLGIQNNYAAQLTLQHFPHLTHLSQADRHFLENISQEYQFKSLPSQVTDTLKRFDRIVPIAATVCNDKTTSQSTTYQIDRYLTHPIFGVLCFFGVLLLLFEAIFSFSIYPMDAIEGLFMHLSTFLKNTLPDSMLTSLLVDGLLAGIGGIVVFIPQIAILFLLIGILEETGYMARAVYLSDSWMRRFGLNGRSLVSLFSGMACSIPAVMAARTISNQRERLLTVLVTPLMSCSARIPVYVILIGILIPTGTRIGIFGAQSLMMFGLYFLGIAAALGISALLKLFIKTQEMSYLVMELPAYRVPYWRNVVLGAWQKVRSFVVDAGKIILAISLVLWGLGNFGPTNEMQEAEQAIRTSTIDSTHIDNAVAEARLEHSFLGYIGKGIEPAIRPLGFDWKIGIALVSSFAAREVFVGTMATIYSVGADDDAGLRARMKAAIDPNTHQKIFTPATIVSLLLFYVFAMQCMSTIAVVKRETNSWRWAFFQLFYMTFLAYSSAFIAYNLLK